MFSQIPRVCAKALCELRIRDKLSVRQPESKDIPLAEKRDDLPKKNREKPNWEIRVTSKGQVTLPKEVRDIMMVREGDNLDACIVDDSLILRRRDDIPESVRMKLFARRELLRMGIDPDVPHPELEPANVQRLVGKLPVDLTDRIRAQREGRDEPE